MINFIKMQGIGNDFVILESKDILLNDLNHNLITKITDRKFGVGCDQLIYLSESIHCDIKMTIFNQDGSQAESCGNATRCVARLIMQRLNKLSCTIETKLRDLNAFAKNKDELTSGLITVNMGKAIFDWKDIPLSHDMDIKNIEFKLPWNNKTIYGYALSMGNPHIVLQFDEIDNIDISQIGSYIENHEFFPNKVNVSFVKILSDNHLKLRVWERGVGETLACGSGACATAYSYLDKANINKEISIDLLGGKLIISLDNQDNIFMKGMAEFVFNGQLL